MSESPPHGATLVILIVDDDEEMRRVLRRAVQREGYKVIEASDGEEALRCLSGERVDVVLSDVRMPGLDGMELLKTVQRDCPDVPVVLMTAFGSVEDAVTAMKLGAAHYVRKPFELGEVLAALERAVEDSRLRQEVLRLREVTGGTEAHQRLIGSSPSMQALREQIGRVAESDANVIVEGESGAGKELVARAIHQLSSRVDRPFVAVNCSAVPEPLFESEFFGHVKGAFTGAVQSRPGLFEESDGSTLFLDEVSSLSQASQAKLLRALEEGQVKRVGATRSHPVDVRVISATNTPLPGLVESETFRSDLYYRLNVITITVPPLRERTADISLLAQRFLDIHTPGSDPPGLTDRARDLLESYSWPGNVRELQNVIRRALVLRDEGPLRASHLPSHIQNQDQTDSAGASGGTGRSAEDIGGGDRPASLEDLERDHILRVLEFTDGNRTQAARILGIDRRTLRRKLKRWAEQM